MGINQKIALFVFLMAPLVASAWTIEKSFDVTADGQLTVKTENGSIDITTHASNTVEVEVRVSGYDEDEFEVDFDHDNSDLSIDGDVKTRSWGRTRVEFTIVVPEAYHVDLSTSGGSISVEGLQGQVEVDTSGGSLSFEDIVGDIEGTTSGGSIEVASVEGEVDVQTSGGSIKVKDVTGDLTVDTSGGSINIRDVAGHTEAETSGGSIRLSNIAGGVDASTSGGSIIAKLEDQPSDDIALQTSGGGITVEMPASASVSVNARANRIKSFLPVDGVTSAKRRLRGDINDGGPLLDLDSSAGNIYIEEI